MRKFDIAGEVHGSRSLQNRDILDASNVDGAQYLLLLVDALLGEGHPVLPMDLALLDRARDLGARESGLVVAVTTGDDGSAQASVVNAGVLNHPVTAATIVGFVVRGDPPQLRDCYVRPTRRPSAVPPRIGRSWTTSLRPSATPPS